MVLEMRRSVRYIPTYPLEARVTMFLSLSFLVFPFLARRGDPIRLESSSFRFGVQMFDVMSMVLEMRSQVLTSKIYHLFSYRFFPLPGLHRPMCLERAGRQGQTTALPTNSTSPCALWRCVTLPLSTTTIV